MTRSLTDVRHVLELAAKGLSKRAISAASGVPRETLRQWISDPEKALSVCDGACRPMDDLNESAYAYLLGIYLGDGCISAHPRTFRLRISCADAYPKIMDEVSQAIHQVMPVKVGRVRSIGCTEVAAYSKHWPCFFPQHGEGMKHERPMVLQPWQREIVERKPRPFLRGLIHSDGWRGDNVAIRKTDLATEYRTYTRYQFSNRSDGIRGLFCWACDLLGIHWTQANRWNISVARRKDVHYMDSFIGPKR